MENQVSKLIDAIQRLSPEASRIWLEMVTAEANYNALMLLTLMIPLVAFGCSFFCFRSMKNHWADEDICGFSMLASVLVGTISLIVVLSNIPEWITGIMNPEGTLAFAIIRIMN